MTEFSSCAVWDQPHPLLTVAAPCPLVPCNAVPGVSTPGLGPSPHSARKDFCFAIRAHLQPNLLHGRFPLQGSATQLNPGAMHGPPPRQARPLPVARPSAALGFFCANRAPVTGDAGPGLAVCWVGVLDAVRHFGSEFNGIQRVQDASASAHLRSCPRGLTSMLSAPHLA